MSSFTGPLKIEFVGEGGRSARLVEPLTWELDYKGSGVTVTVPAGFESDGATVPRPLWWLMPAWGDKGTRAAILHDYLLGLIDPTPGSHYRYAREYADQQFFEALVALGVPEWRSRICWLGVRAYGLYYGWIGIYLRQLLG